MRHFHHLRRHAATDLEEPATPADESPDDENLEGAPLPFVVPPYAARMRAAQARRRRR